MACLLLKSACLLLKMACLLLKSAYLLTKKIYNFSGDVKDSVAYVTILNRLAPAKCSLAALDRYTR